MVSEEEGTGIGTETVAEVTGTGEEAGTETESQRGVGAVTVSDDEEEAVTRNEVGVVIVSDGGVGPPMTAEIVNVEVGPGTEKDVRHRSVLSGKWGEGVLELRLDSVSDLDAPGPL